MADKKQTEKQEAIGLINAAITLCNNFPKLEMNKNLVSQNLSPFSFLINICDILGCYEELLDWLVKMLTYSLPTIEMGVKTILLSNLKNLISCSLDPRIPNELRLDLNAFTNDDKGFIFDIASIDYLNMLSVSPLTDEGKSLYFGTEKVYSPYKLLRGEDFNAFLWTVANKKVFSRPIQASSIGFDDAKIFEIQKIINPSTDPIVLGTVTKGDSDNILSIVTDEKIINNFSNTTFDAKSGTIINNTFEYEYSMLPFSNNNTSANWYVNRDTFFNFLLPQNKKKERYYSKDIPIINVRLIQDQTFNKNKLQVTILPKPTVHLPRKGEPAYRIQRLLFNEKGEPDQNGRFTVKKLGVSDNDTTVTYNVEGGSVTIDKKSGSYKLNGDPLKCLFECYKGLTIYEFNYDFIMGMKLFDPQVIAVQLMSALNVPLSFTLGLEVTKTQILGRERIVEVIEKLIEADGSTINDCMFSFSNDRYNQMLDDAELKKSRNYGFKGGKSDAFSINDENILNILSEYSEDATLEENSEVLKRAFTEVTANITKGIDTVDAYGIRVNIIKSLVINFVNTITTSIITPKIVMLLEINRYMATNHVDFKFPSIEDLINSMWNIIFSIIKEIVDLVLRELLSFVLGQLKPLIDCITSELIKEQIDQYRRLIKLIIECGSRRGKKSNDPTKLDVVEHADIVDTPIPQPQDTTC